MQGSENCIIVSYLPTARSVALGRPKDMQVKDLPTNIALQIITSDTIINSLNYNRSIKKYVAVKINHHVHMDEQKTILNIRYPNLINILKVSW